MNRGRSTPAFADTLGITDSAFALLRDLIEQQLGVFYDDSKRDILADKLSQIVTRYEMHSFLDYYYALKYDADSERYWLELADYLSVPETYFWRQPDQFQVVAQTLAPAHFAKHNSPLRIWSAACCTGEEPLSIAMALMESDAFKQGPIEIIASDASSRMVNRARAGLYGERSLRNLSPEWRARYFRQENGGWRITPEVHERVQWRVINLMSPDMMQTLPLIDIAFCRNVFIYFSDTAIKRVAERLAEGIRPGGKLFLGAAESLTRLDTNFTLEEIGKTFVYINTKANRPSLNGRAHAVRAGSEI